MPCKEAGSTNYGTSIVKSDEYVLLADSCLSNGCTLDEAIKHIQFIDDCLTMKRLVQFIQRRKESCFTVTGRVRQNRSFKSLMNNRLDKLLDELNSQQTVTL